jgi:ApaG protein
LHRRATLGMVPRMSVAVTRGVRVSVEARYLPQQSAPRNQRFVFAYTVTVSNEGEDAVQLRTRHWVITDGNNQVEEVRGEGVVGEKPILEPNQSFQYTSGCVLKTPWGTMNGTYQMHRRDGSWFDAQIAPFLLAAPAVVPQGKPN